MAITYISYKDEGSYGPCIGIDQPVYDAWMEVHGVKVGEHCVGIPWGETPEGQTDFGWITRAQAIRIARQHGVELHES